VAGNTREAKEGSTTGGKGSAPLAKPEKSLDITYEPLTRRPRETRGGGALIRETKQSGGGEEEVVSAKQKGGKGGATLTSMGRRLLKF